MINNKTEGQSLKGTGIHLREDRVSHGPVAAYLVAQSLVLQRAYARRHQTKYIKCFS
jgi:hypothetical protein